MEDEDYWNNSKTIGFSFDDEDVNTASALFESTKNVHHGRTQSSSSGGSVFGFPEAQNRNMPIEKLVSKRSLGILLGQTSTANKTGHGDSSEIAVLRKQIAAQWETPPAASTIRSIVLGQPVSLHLYRSLEWKSKLLDEAVQSKDGNAILQVVLFLRSTLNDKLFHRLLIFQPTAAPVYLHYLTTRLEARPAVDLLLALGQTREAALKDFEFSIQRHQNLNKRSGKLKALVRDHFSSSNVEERPFVDNFSKYVEWQLSHGGRQSDKVSSTLKTLCCNHWHDPPDNPKSPFHFTSFLGVSEKMFHWKGVTSLASLQHWDDLSAFILTKGWLGGKKLKTEISAEKIVLALHKVPAPSTVIKEYFNLIDSYEKKLELARKLACHQLAIDALVALRDRQGLVQYQANLKPQSDDYIYAETALNSNVKWKI